MRPGIVLHATPTLRAAIALGARAGQGSLPADGAALVFVDAKEARAVKHPSSVRELLRMEGYSLGAAVVEGKVLAALLLPGAMLAFRDRPAPFASRCLLVQSPQRSEPVALLGIEIDSVGVFPTGATKGTVMHQNEEIPVWEVERTLTKVEALSRRRRGRTPHELDGSR